MHFEIHVEDTSGKCALETLIPKLLNDAATYRIHSYKGLGQIPKGLRPGTDASKRVLLDRLPKLLQGHGKSLQDGTVVIICDLDERDKISFLSELHQVLDACNPKPETLFCLAVEEFEAWYLGDLDAVKRAYPRAKNSILINYTNDSICGTWEYLADAVYKGGSKELKKRGRSAVGSEKTIWAKEITPYMNVNNNKSPSFNEMFANLTTINKKRTS
jgi:hypothetical protein